MGEGRREDRWRAAVRWVAFGIAVALGCGVIAGGRVPLAALSPHVMLGALVAGRVAGWMTLLGVPVLVACLARRRWFCRWLCPAGLLQECVSRGRVRRGARVSRWPRLGRWFAVLTLGGALVGVPLFLWLDPLAIFAGFCGVAARGPVAGWVPWVAAAGLPALLLFEWVRPKVWCHRLCPLGALQDLFMGLRHHRGSVAAPAVGGMLPPLVRRGFFGVLLGVGGGVLAGRAGGEPQVLVRPPGAVSEGAFRGLCIRCGGCVRVCPSRILGADLGGGGATGFLAPRADFGVEYCREDCVSCTRVCPSGALRELTLEAKRRWVMGVARLDLGLCLLANGGECTACLRACPYEALEMRSGDGGFTFDPTVLVDRCTGCGACEAVCPVRPVRAVRVAGVTRGG